MEGLVNMCPHDIVVFADDGVSVIATFPRAETTCGPLRLVESPAVSMGYLSGTRVPVQLRTHYTGLSYEPSAHAIIVSQLVAQYMVSRPNQPMPRRVMCIFAPDTGPSGVVRDGRGTIVGTKRLVQYA